LDEIQAMTKRRAPVLENLRREKPKRPINNISKGLYSSENTYSRESLSKYFLIKNISNNVIPQEIKAAIDATLQASLASSILKLLLNKGQIFIDEIILQIY
jgi:hypothetical protein